MQQSHLYQLTELSDLFADACIRDESGRLMFLSVYGRDTALQQLFAAIHLPTAQGGLDVLKLKSTDPDTREGICRAFINEPDRLTKLSGKLPRCLFGQLGHVWIYDPAMIQADKSNGMGWVMLDKTRYDKEGLRKAAREAVWQLLCHLSPIPLLPHWADIVWAGIGRQLVVDMSITSFAPVGRLAAARVKIDDTFPTQISAMVKAGQLTLHPAEKPCPQQELLAA